MLRKVRLSLVCRSFRSTGSAVSNDTPSHRMQETRVRLDEPITSGVTCRVNGKWTAASISRCLMRKAGSAMGEVSRAVSPHQDQRRAGRPAPEPRVTVAAARFEPGEQDAKLVRVMTADQPTREMDRNRDQPVEQRAPKDEQDA